MKSRLTCSSAASSWLLLLDRCWMISSNATKSISSVPQMNYIQLIQETRLSLLAITYRRHRRHTVNRSIVVVDSWIRIFGSIRLENQALFFNSWASSLGQLTRLLPIYPAFPIGQSIEFWAKCLFFLFTCEVIHYLKELGSASGLAHSIRGFMFNGGEVFRAWCNWR